MSQANLNRAVELYGDKRSRRHFVPTAPLRPILQKAIDNRQMVDDGMSAMEAIALDTGIYIRVLYAILHERNFVEFDIADKLVTHTVGPQEWQAESLCEHYLPENVDDYRTVPR